MKSQTTLVNIMAIAATLAYCWAIWWFSGLFSVLVPATNGTYEASMLSVVLVAPISDGIWTQAIHWQLIAIASLAAALVARGKLQDAQTADYSPLIAHGFYLLTISFLHIVGMLASFVGFAYTLK